MQGKACGRPGLELEVSNGTVGAGTDRLYGRDFSGVPKYEWTLDGDVVQDSTESSWWWNAPAEDRQFELKLRIYDSGGSAEDTEYTIYMTQISWRRA